MLRDPQDFIPFFEESLRDYINQNNITPSSLQGSADEPQKEQDARRLASYRIGFEGSFGANYVSPRTLCARFLRSLLCVEGIVTKCTTTHRRWGFAYVRILQARLCIQNSCALYIIATRLVSSSIARMSTPPRSAPQRRLASLIPQRCASMTRLISLTRTLPAAL